MTGPFAHATAVSSDGPGRWSARIHEGWDILGNANGGYLLAIAGRGITEATARPDPVTVTAHYLAPGRPGDATIDVEVLKEGRRFATARAVLSAPDDDGRMRPTLAVMAAVGDLAEPGEDVLVQGEAPKMPPPDECVAAGPETDFPDFMKRIDLRIPYEDAGFSRGEPSGRPLMQGWFRLRDDEPVDTLALLCAVDAFPPTVFNANLPFAWVPTVELTTHIRRRPAPGWLACRQTTRFVTGGFLEADGEVWDSTGALVAQSRQLALAPRPSQP